MSKIFKRNDGSFTMNEFEGDFQNVSVIPAKYSSSDKYGKYRRHTKEQV